MRKIKVGILILSNSWGGAEVSVYKLADYVDKDKFEVYLLVNDFLVEFYQNLPDIKVINLGSLESNKKLGKIITLLRIRSGWRSMVKNYRLDLIHMNLESSILVVGWDWKRLGVPLVFSLRGEETRLYHHPKTLEQMILRLIISRLITSHKVVTHSVSKWLIKDFPVSIRKRIKIIYSGIDTEKFKPTPIKKKNHNQKIVFHFGRLVVNKGIEDLMSVAEDLPDYEFWFAGKGPLSEIINLPNTRYLGFKSHEELIRLLGQVTICCFPSYAEGFGTVGLESMACGKAIIATKTGFSDYVSDREDGWLIEIGDQDGLRGGITELLENYELRRKIEVKARQKALKFSYKKTIRDYERLYHGAVIR